MTEETSRAINLEISSRFSSRTSRNLEEMKSELNSHILDIINSAFEKRVIPSIKNAVVGQNSAIKKNKFGPHPSNFSQVRPQRDFRSNGLHPEKDSQVGQDAQKDFP